MIGFAARDIDKQRSNWRSAVGSDFEGASPYSTIKDTVAELGWGIVPSIIPQAEVAQLRSRLDHFVKDSPSLALLPTEALAIETVQHAVFGKAAIAAITEVL